MLKLRLIALFVLGFVFARSQDFHLKSYFERTQINTGFIYAVLQDKTGYITVLSGEGIHQLERGNWRKLLDIQSLNNTYPSAAVSNPKGLIIGNSYGDLFIYNDGNVSELKCPLKNKIDQIYYHQGKYFIKDISNKLLILDNNFDYVELLQDEITHLSQFKNNLYLLKEDVISKWNNESSTFIPTEENKFQIDKIFFSPDGKAIFSNEKKLFSGKLNPLKITDSLSLNLAFINSGYFGKKVYLSYNGAIHIFEESGGKLKFYGKIGIQSGLNGGEINCLYEDTEGQLWIGTNEQGLFSLPQLHYVEFKELPGKIQALSKDKGNYYVLSSNRVFKIDMPGEALIRFNEIYANPSPLTSFLVQNDSIITTDYQYLHIQSKMDDKKISLPQKDLKINRIQIFNSRVYISTVTHGVYRININSPEPQWENWDTKTGLSHNDAAMVYEISGENDVWIFTNGAGLIKYDGNSFEYFGNATGLRSFDINDVHYINNELWVASNGEGVYKIDLQNDSLSFLSETESNNPLYAYSLDFKDGKLSVLSVEDLFIYSTQTQQMFKQTHDVNFINGKHFQIDQDGYLILANGRLFLSKLNYSKRIVDDRIHIQNVKVNGERLSQKNHFSLPYKQYTIEFTIQAISPFYGKDFLYQHKLDGYDEEWSKPSPLSYIIYKKLPDGKYTLNVRPILGNKALSPTQVSFEIRTPFWKKWWFILLGLLFIIALIYFILSIRVRRIRRLAKRLSLMVEKRTSLLKRQNDQLKEFTYAISHDLKNPVLNIEGLSNILLEEDIPKEEAEQIHEMLKETSGQLHKNLLGLIEVLKSGGKTTVEELSIQELMKEVEVENNSAILNKDVKLIYNLKQDKITFNKENLKSVLANLTNNAIKYSHPDRPPIILVNSYQKKDYIFIEIHDNGLGIDMEKDGDKLFGMFRRIHTNAEGSGIGMYMVNNIIQRAGGQIDVTSQLDVGTCFTVKIPVNLETLH